VADIRISNGEFLNKIEACADDLGDGRNLTGENEQPGMESSGNDGLDSSPTEAFPNLLQYLIISLVSSMASMLLLAIFQPLANLDRPGFRKLRQEVSIEGLHGTEVELYLEACS
jgi:hypothetical protein